MSEVFNIEAMSVVGKARIAIFTEEICNEERNVEIGLYVQFSVQFYFYTGAAPNPVLK